MMRRPRILIAGAALIAATNAIVLAGVAYNRSGEPEALLRLSERELKAPERWGLREEDSGLTLRLAWRILRTRMPNQPGYVDFGQSGGGEATWLDKPKLVELGFDVSKSATTQVGRYSRGEKQLPKEAVFVLEHAGAAWQAALAHAEERAKQARDAAAANPGDKNLATRAVFAAKQLADEQHKHSRLFAIDAGRDETALRAKYPDRSRYAIAHGKIAIYYLSAGPTGYVSELSIPGVNVPLEYRGTVDRNRPFEVSLAFGKRLEPWLTGAKPGQ